LLPQIARNPNALDRFRREIQLSRRVTHPSVCRVYELGNGGPNDTIPFFTMELLRGRTLSAYLREIGPIAPEEALPIAQQLINGMEAAHKVGIVHRDFKAGNIFLVGSGNATRAVITDFGLARAVSPETEPPVATRATIAGTPAYMAPEQFQGGAVGPATDIYALGVVLHEMITGRLPFQSGERPMVPPEWDRVIRRCLEVDPERRYASASDVWRGLSGERRRTKAKPRRSILAAVAAAIALAALGSQWDRLPLFTYELNPEARAWYERGVGALRDGDYYSASQELAQAVKIDPGYPLSHARLAEALTEQDYGDRARQEMVEASARALQTRLTAADSLQLEAIHLTLARDHTGAIDRLERLLKIAPESQRPTVLVDLGRSHEKNEEPDKARSCYEDALRVAPDMAAAHLRLGIVMLRADSLGPARQQFEGAARIWEMAGNYHGLVEALYYQVLVASHQNRLDDARKILNRAQEIAITTRAEHQRVRLLLQFGVVDRRANRLDEARQHAEQAVELARANGMENIASQGLIDLGNSYFTARLIEPARRCFTDALEMAGQTKARRTEARALLSLGSLALQIRQSDQGRKYVERALPFYREGGYRHEYALALALLARAQEYTGDIAGALATLQEQTRLAELTGDRNAVASALFREAASLNRLERFPQSIRTADRGLSLAAGSPDVVAIAYARLNRADSLWRLGRYDEAAVTLDQVDSATQAPDVRRQTQQRLAEVRAEMSYSRHDWAAARRYAEETLRRMEDYSPLLETRARAFVGLIEAQTGNPSAGVAPCRKAVNAARAAGDNQSMIEAGLQLARAYLLAGQKASAIQAATEAQAGMARLGRHASAWQACRIVEAAGGSVSCEPALSVLAESWNKKDVDGFLSRPDLRFQ